MSDSPSVGIDLGTTYSCVAVFEKGSVKVIQNELGSHTMPSCVAFTDTERLIGQSAKQQGARNAKNTIYEVKRLIGRKYDDPTVKKDTANWPFEVLNVDGIPKIKTSYQKMDLTVSPEEISAMVLSKMKHIAEVYLNTTVEDVVITVPAYFNDSQRQATIDAGRIAGLNVRKILNEPTAAAMAYGIDRKVKGEKNVLVYDLGGGTLDVSVLNIGEDLIFEVKATSGDTHLGGVDFDKAMAESLLQDFETKHKEDPRSDMRAVYLLREECDVAKRQLSTTNEAIIDICNFYKGIDLCTTISRAKFEMICSILFKKCIEPVEKALEDADLCKEDIDDVVLVGGSTRIPMIQTLLKNYFNRLELIQNINADEAVAYGAAIQAALLSGECHKDVRDMVLLDVTPLSLGIEICKGEMSVIISRNSCIPCKISNGYTTQGDDHDGVIISVYEGERSMVADNKLLGVFTLMGIEKAPEGVPQIEVTFSLDDNGILTASAVDKKTGSEKELRIKMDKGRLSDREIREMMSNRERYEKEDREKAKKLHMKSDLEMLLFRARQFIENVGDKLQRADKLRAERVIENSLGWLDNHTVPGLAELEDILSDTRSKLMKYLPNLNLDKYSFKSF